jgi:hypothetical protein
MVVALAVVVVWVALVAGSVVTFHGGHGEGTITYDLTWDRDAVSLGSDGWNIQTASGVLVTVNSGFLTTRTMQLGACNHSHVGWLRRITGLFGTAVAAAGHDSGEVDPALLEANHTEDLATVVAATVGTVTVSEPSFCTAHWAVARHQDLSSNATIDVAGTWSVDGSDPVRFRFVATSAWGGETQLLDESGVATHVELGQPIRVAAHRKLSTMFDDVNFASGDEQSAGEAILARLVRDTRWIVLQGVTH